MIQFVANYDDLSTEKGYQFKFYCDKCGNGYLSEFMLSKVGTAAGLLHTAGSFFGGLLGKVGDSAYQIQKAIGGKAHDDALQKAVTEAKKHFHQCTRCGKWVCPEVCWNTKVGLCEHCAPDEEEELAAQKAQAAAEQIQAKTRAVDYTQDLEFKGKTQLNVCAECGAKNSPNAKFCAECGKALAVIPKAAFCTNCGAKIGAEKFCPQCGAKGS